jgi:hypothetical protein
MEGLGLGLSLNTTAKPERVLKLTKSELIILKSKVEESLQMNDATKKAELLRVIDTLLSSRLPGTDDQRPIENLVNYKYALENDKDKIESIRSVLLRELDNFLDAVQTGGKRRRHRTKRSKTRRSRKTRRSCR